METQKDSAVDNSPLPALRHDLEAMPVEHEGKPMFVLRDLEGLSEKPMALSAGALAVASLLNGRNSASDIKIIFAKHSGAFLSSVEILGIAENLKTAGLLETPEIEARRRQAMKDFLNNPARSCVLKDTMYPSGILELSGFLAKFFAGTGMPAGFPVETPKYRSSPAGIFCPHADFQRAGAVYAQVYGALSEFSPPDVIVALGTAHARPNSPWVMTKKDYETPYGPVKCDAELYQEIRNQLWYDPLEEEWVHRREHSLELQAVWLKYIWRDKTPAWAPVLCSNFERFASDRPPSAASAMEGALSKIGSVLAGRVKRGQKIMILAGVDMSHKGPRFGDEGDLGEEELKQIEADDRISLGYALNLEADKFYMSVAAGGNKRRICGLSGLYTAVRWIKDIAAGREISGKLLDYRRPPDPMGGMISFAGGIFMKTGDGKR